MQFLTFLDQIIISMKDIFKGGDKNKLLIVSLREDSIKTNWLMKSWIKCETFVNNEVNLLL